MGVFYYYISMNQLIGIDEVGRGCLAGPVVAAAVCWNDQVLIEGIKDSKLLTAGNRRRMATLIHKYYLVGIGVIGEQAIDERGIVRATFEAMHSAVLALPYSHLPVLVDGPLIPKRLFGIARGVTALVDGDDKIPAISAASIVAKVYRDSLMEKLAIEFPIYNWVSNKGYPTPLHKDMIKLHGLTKYHRKSFCSFLDKV